MIFVEIFAKLFGSLIGLVLWLVKIAVIVFILIEWPPIGVALVIVYCSLSVLWAIRAPKQTLKLLEAQEKEVKEKDIEIEELQNIIQDLRSEMKISDQEINEVLKEAAKAKMNSTYQHGFDLGRLIGYSSALADVDNDMVQEFQGWEKSEISKYHREQAEQFAESNYKKVI